MNKAGLAQKIMKTVLFTYAPLCAGALLLGCGSAPAPAPTSPGPGSELASSPEQSSSTPPSSESAAASAEKAPAQSPAPGAEPKLQKAELPTPLSEDEKKDFSTKCKALANAVSKKGNPNPLLGLEEVLKKPPKMPEADLQRCQAVLTKNYRAYVFSMMQSEAQMILKKLGEKMVFAFESNKTLCPSADPIPANIQDVAKGPYTTSEADWNSAGWKCVGFELPGQATRFQYSIKSDPKTSSFEIIARGCPELNDQWLIMVVKGQLKNGKMIVEGGVAP